MSEAFLNGRVTLHAGDSRDVLKTLADNSIDSVVCDPPYALNFMNKKWDTGDTVNSSDFWAECLRVLKPGGHVVAFSGTRTYHRMACAIEDAGFEVRDMLSWLYGSGFPKSHDVSKGIDRAAGAEREVIGKRQFANGSFARDGAVMGQHGVYGAAAGNPLMTAPATDSAIEWQGWGTALKPSCEPICFGRKPLTGTVAANVLEHGTGAINIDGCRIEAGADHASNCAREGVSGIWREHGSQPGIRTEASPLGRWPANIIHDGSEEVIAAFPETGLSSGGTGDSSKDWKGNGWGNLSSASGGFGDSGSAARFFYTAKADSDDRLGSKHPTVKPVDLMQWLCRLVTPKGGTVLDPFAGTGTTGEAAFREGFNAVLIEREEEYQADIRRRMALCLAGPEERKRESIKAKLGDVPFEPGSLFA